MKGDTVRTGANRLAARRPSILIAAYHFPPEGSVGTFRTLRLVRQLVERDWDVTVLTGTGATYSSGCVLDSDLLSRVPGSVRVVRAPVLRPIDAVSSLGKSPRANPPAAAVPQPETAAAGGAPRKPSMVQRAKQQLDALTRIPDSHVGWLVPAVVKGILTAAGRTPDVLYSSSPPWTGQLVARALAPALGCPWVADFRDPWSRAPWREGQLTIARRVAEVFERSVIRAADAIVFTTRTNLDDFAAFYGPAIASKFHLVRNGCERGEFDGVEPLATDGRFTLLHAGSLYGGRKPTALFAALAALRDRGVIGARTFCFRQIGRVSLAGFDMAAERARLGLEGLVELVAAQPRRDILREMLSASCLLLLQPGTTVSIPGKLFEYFASGRPILAVAEEGETSDLVRASGRGLAVLPDDQSGLERAIAMLVQGRFSAGAPQPELFDGELRTGELIAVLEAVCRRPVRTFRPSAESAPEVRP
jgi:glycosyltransferase involved in cell wall biosynthesis